MKFKTLEQRKAIAQKGIATRKANKEKRNQEIKDKWLYANGLGQQIDVLERRLAQLVRFEKLGAIATSLSNAALLTADEIVAGALPVGPTCGVYFLVQGNEVVYVGQSRNVFVRVSTHAHGKAFDRYAYVPCSATALDKLESLYIHVLRPRLNGNVNAQEKTAPLKFNQLFGDEINDLAIPAPSYARAGARQRAAGSPL